MVLGAVVEVVVAEEVVVEAVVVAFLELNVVIEKEKVEVFLIGSQAIKMIKILQAQLIQL